MLSRLSCRRLLPNQPASVPSSQPADKSRSLPQDQTANWIGRFGVRTWPQGAMRHRAVADPRTAQRSSRAATQPLTANHDADAGLARDAAEPDADADADAGWSDPRLKGPSCPSCSHHVNTHPRSSPAVRSPVTSTGDDVDLVASTLRGSPAVSFSSSSSLSSAMTTSPCASCVPVAAAATDNADARGRCADGCGLCSALLDAGSNSSASTRM
eukprot:138417-Rhodomonas_salina.1